MCIVRMLCSGQLYLHITAGQLRDKPIRSVKDFVVNDSLFINVLLELLFLTELIQTRLVAAGFTQFRSILLISCPLSSAVIHYALHSHSTLLPAPQAIDSS